MVLTSETQMDFVIRGAGPTNIAARASVRGIRSTSSRWARTAESAAKARMPISSIVDADVPLYLGFVAGSTKAGTLNARTCSGVESRSGVAPFHRPDWHRE